MELSCGPYILTMTDVGADADRDAGGPHERVTDLTGGVRPSSRHRVACRGPGGVEHAVLLAAGGGASGVHPRSAVVVGGVCYAAVGDHVCALALPALALRWSTRVDLATCFGVYHAACSGCLVSHGELEVARVELDGRVAWAVGGADIFTGDFRLDGDRVEVEDFGGRRYAYDLATGREARG